jgi:hypothetical protein
MNVWLRRFLGVCPVLVTILWIAGIAHFRAYDVQAREWAAITAGAFALHLLVQRASPPRPLPALPKGTSPFLLAALVAAILAIVAAILGGLLEHLIETYRPSTTSWALRTTWHAACTFAASYCGFVPRLHHATTPPPRR